jgi:hypothetical protein
MPHPQRFSGESVVSWNDLDITISVPWYLGLMFRTRKEDGVLMEATAGVSSRLHLQVSGVMCHLDTCRAEREQGAGVFWGTSEGLLYSPTFCSHPTSDNQRGKHELLSPAEVQLCH